MLQCDAMQCKEQWDPNDFMGVWRLDIKEAKVAMVVEFVDHRNYRRGVLELLREEILATHVPSIISLD